MQSLISVGSGGVWGKGLGEGLQKYRFLAEAHNDFIFAIIGEELGLAGTCATLLLFCALVGVCFWIAYRTIDFQGAVLASGLTMMIAIPTFVHMSVVLGVIPPTGLALPFISYGGSSMVVNLAAMGVLMNIARRVDKEAFERSRLRRGRRGRERHNLRPTPSWAKI
jgi:cell division protein FtsW